MSARGDLHAGATRSSSVDEVIEQLTGWFDERFDRLTAVADDLIAQLSFDSEGLLDLSEGCRRRLKSAASRFLADNLVVDGCGLIFAHSALGTPNGHLEWWVREDETRFARYSFGVVPGGDRYYDYEQHEWFIRAVNEGMPALVGPYIDYLGVEAYVLTLTVPADVGSQRVGAVGNDIQAEDVEAALLPIMRSCDHELILTGSDNNVVLSNSAKYLPGERISNDASFRRVSLMRGASDVQLLIQHGQ